MIDQWYAIALASGAASKAKLRWVERGPRDGTYWRSEELDDTIIGKSCRDQNVTLFMPMEKVVCLNKKSHKQSVRLLPMIPGYAFVRGFQSFDQIDDLEGVAQVVRTGYDAPLLISDREIGALRSAEYQVNVAFLLEYMGKNRKGRKINTARLKAMFPAEMEVVIQHGLLKGMSAVVEKAKGRNKVQVFVEGLNKRVELDVDNLAAA